MFIRICKRPRIHYPAISLCLPSFNGHFRHLLSVRGTILVIFPSGIIINHDEAVFSPLRIFREPDLIMFSFRLIIIFVAAYFALATSAFGDNSQEPDSQVWKVGERRWTVQEEENYGKWIETNVTEDFFMYHKIPVDCADVPYAIRWIYARIAHLPAAATTGNNRLMGHWSGDFAHLPTGPTWDKDRRFRAALLHMLSTTSTRSLASDTYPTRIDSTLR